MSATRLASCNAETLLETGELPLKHLTEFARREGRRPRSIYQIHKWFARRLPSVFRSVLVAAALPPDGDFWNAYYNSPDLSAWTILDPFVGGGTSLVEASRLGAAVIGVDVDPIACAITRAELAIHDMPDLEETLAILTTQVATRLKPFYAVPDINGIPMTALHYFWVQVVSCPDCGMETDAHPNYSLANDTEGAWGFCSNCGEVGPYSRTAKEFICHQCTTVTPTESGPVIHGVFNCPHCRTSHPLIELGRTIGGPPRWKLFAAEVYPQNATRHPVPIKNRLFIKADPTLHARFAAAEQELRQLKTAGTIRLPDHAVPTANRTDTRLTDYGYQLWNDLFNPRQQLHLGLLATEINKLPEPTRHFVALAFSNHLTTNCMLTSYASAWRRLTPLFSIRGFRHISRPIELNPWTARTGRGSFPNAIRQLQQAAKSMRFPKEPLRGGKFKSVTDRKSNNLPTIINGDACALTGLADASVDMALSDPPYFDNVAYSELSEFFQPWLEWFGITLPSTQREEQVSASLVPRRGDLARNANFAKRLGTAFTEVRRVLRDEGMFAFTYRHSNPEAWEAMAKALAASGLRPVQVLPVPGEAGAGLHAREGNSGTSLWDALLVFRKRTGASYTVLIAPEAEEHALRHVLHWQEKLRVESQLSFTDGDYLNLWRATVVAASLGFFGEASNDGKSLSTLLARSYIASKKDHTDAGFCQTNPL